MGIFVFICFHSPHILSVKYIFVKSHVSLEIYSSQYISFFGLLVNSIGVWFYVVNEFVWWLFWQPSRAGGLTTPTVTLTVTPVVSVPGRGTATLLLPWPRDGSWTMSVLIRDLCWTTAGKVRKLIIYFL